MNNSGVPFDAKRTSSGVGVIYDTKLVQMIKFNTVSERNAKAISETAGAKLKLFITCAPTENANESGHTANLMEFAVCTRSSDQNYCQKMHILGDLYAVIGLDLKEHLPKQFGKAEASDGSCRNEWFAPCLICHWTSVESQKHFFLENWCAELHMSTSENQGVVSKRLCTDKVVGSKTSQSKRLEKLLRR